ncbi:hypothetical protein QA612_20160 [Evansella sp. AB-P1]|uniref:hypothetical protein n=1 Tax=Evansella sp. AB-P1 TaxID=3037653 RepID=UPI00241DEBFC|nr:hypothetical protein [Evansella sp. AB-P1]MDG5789777.1 hypothetical protein [Evansella sp. AB-P1]
MFKKSIYFLWSQLYLLIEVFKEWKMNWGSIVILIVPILVSLPTVNVYIEQSPWFIALVIIIVVIAWLHSNRIVRNISALKRKLSAVENQRDTLVESLEATPTMIVNHLYQEIGLTSKDRITIYRYHDDEFINIGRHSLNVDFNKKGRYSYPKDKGFIGQCWAGEEVYKENLPKPDNSLDHYIDRVSKLSNIEKGVLRKLSMKSRCYYCRKLINHKNSPVAVIVFETIDKSFRDKKKTIGDALDGQFGKLLLESKENNLPVGKG